ncbi:MAG: ABC transporter ATP-binding protein [Clostridia bacterium]|nr:ABC transporter ATP-binding protein [Clostridia bacterium]
MIQVNNLTQVYPSGKGIFDVTFQVAEGEVFGYLGPNGAGKTTTIRNLMGFTNATQGEALINEKDCRKDAAAIQKSVGYLPGEMNMLDYMTGIEFLKFLGDMRAMKSTEKRDALIKKFELDTEGKIKKMSKGMKQKLGIIAAFMHDPQVYILDEPTSGLDPLMQNVFMELIKEEKKRGKTILMSSHIFEEVQRVCDRVGIIKDGRIVTIQNIADLNSVNKKKYVLTFADKKDMKKFENSPFETDKTDINILKVSVSYPFNDFFALLSSCDIKSLEVEHVTLENMFMKYYES